MSDDLTPTPEDATAAAEEAPKRRKRRTPPRETAKDRRYFAYYLELGEDRTLDKVAAHFGVHPVYIRRRSGYFGWVDKARAYDIAALQASIDRQVEMVTRERQERMVERVRMARMLRVKAYRYIEERELDEEIDPRTGRKSKVMGKDQMEMAIKMLALADKTERLDFGEPTERNEQTGSGGGPLEIKIIRTTASPAPAVLKDPEPEAG